jgi:serine/threonine protein phosphatase PrpC
MTESDGTLSAGGWTLGIAMRTCRSASAIPANFHGLYAGTDYDAPRRGTVIGIAHGHGPARAAAEAAQLTIQGFVESYFGARSTIGNARAAGRSLATINSWLFNHSTNDPDRQQSSASFLALLLFARQAAIIHVGDNRAYRLRGGEAAPLTFTHLRRISGRPRMPRTVGADHDVKIDYLEEEAQPGDRYILVTPGVAEGLAEDQLMALMEQGLSRDALADALLDRPEADEATAVVVDALTIPEASFDDLSSTFGRLPLRPAPRDGDVVDGFLIKRTLYRSRYTLLKLADDKLENREVVIKFPLPAMLQDQVFQAGFMREAWIGASVRSPWVAHYLTLPPERQSRLYLVLPYYRGETLEQRLLRRPRISFADGISIAFKLCAAVRDLESLQVIHRDLKPENIILLTNGDVRLLDLGLAYLPGFDDPDDTRLGGTTRYMAPELFGKTPAGPRSEVFSLGITIYRMFSGGEFPFGRRETLPLARLRPDIPPWLGQCLKRAIDIDPDQRYANAEAFAKALEEGLLHGEKDGPGRRSWGDWLRSRQAWQIVSAVLATALTISLVHQLMH